MSQDFYSLVLQPTDMFSNFLEHNVGSVAKSKIICVSNTIFIQIFRVLTKPGPRPWPTLWPIQIYSFIVFLSEPLVDPVFLEHCSGEFGTMIVCYRKIGTVYYKHTNSQKDNIQSTEFISLLQFQPKSHAIRALCDPRPRYTHWFYEVRLQYSCCIAGAPRLGRCYLVLSNPSNI